VVLRRVGGLVVVVVCGAGFVVPGVAGASFLREPVRGISVAGVGGFAPSGVGVDSAGDLWVGNGVGNVLDEFEPFLAGNGFVGSFKVGVVPSSFAIESSTVGNGDFYVVDPGSGAVEVFEAGGAHARVQSWPPLFDRHVAIDNSASEMEDPSACGTLPLGVGECIVYRLTAGETGGVEKLDSKEEAEPFTCATTGCEKYVNEGKAKGVRNKLTGIPSAPAKGFGSGGAPPAGLVVDPAGDIFVGSAELGVVYEFRASGAFVGEFSLHSPEVPLLEGHTGVLDTVAFDAASGHLLVDESTEIGGKSLGAIDEFDPSSGKFVVPQITGTAGGGVLHDPVAIATDAEGDVYVVDQKTTPEAVDVYSKGAFVPALTLGVAAERIGTVAVLNGSVNPDAVVNGAPVTECYFEYVSEQAFQEAVGKKESGFVKAERHECEPTAGGLAVNEEEQPVEAHIKTLKAGTTYEYRLVAMSGGVDGGVADTPSLAFTAPGAPLVTGSAAEGVSSSFAELQAQVKPDGAATAYHFEYLTTAAWTANEDSFSGPEPATSVPVEPRAIGSGGPTGGASESVAQDIAGLTAGSEYHFRVVATNQAGTTFGETNEAHEETQRTFTTQPAATLGLPDDRAWELVTPANKEGGSDMFAQPKINGAFINSKSVGAPSLSGDGFVLEAFSAFGAFPSAGLQSYYVFTRELGKGKWSFKSLASPKLGAQELGSLVFDPVDLSRVAFTDSIGPELGEHGSTPVELAGPPGAGPLCEGAASLETAVSQACYIKLHQDPAHGEKLGGSESIIDTHAVGASQSLGRVVLDSNDNTTCPTPNGASLKVKTGDVLCEWDGGYETLEHGETIPELRLVSLAPGSETQPASECGATLGAFATGGGAHNAVSTDANTIVFTAPAFEGREGSTGGLVGPGCWNEAQETKTGKPVNPPQLYARVDGQTLMLSAPEGGVKEGAGIPREYPVTYAGASEDGSRVFFLTEAWLTENHPETHDRELYECEITIEGDQPACKLTRVSVPVNAKGEAEPNSGAGVERAPAVAANGSAVYFMAFEALATGAKTEPTVGEGQAGAVNVYRYQTTSETTSYVATVDNRDYSDQPCKVRGAVCSQADWYASPDGRYLLFGSTLPIGVYNTAADTCPETIPFDSHGARSRCSELYRYDALAAEQGERGVVCVSCGSGGADGEGNAEFARSAVEEPWSGPPVGMSDNGSYVFFDSVARLVPAADNQTLDVYEWEADGVGGCGLVGGCVRLLSSPNDSFPSYFLGSSSYEYEDKATHGMVVVEGGNVFFGTHAQLVPQDTNSVGNIYDARVCVPESPCIKPPTGGTVQCEGGSCQVPPAAPVDQTPSSETFSGAGNLSPPPPPPPTAAEVRAKKLAKALKACKKDKKKSKRVACERSARKRYGPVKAAKKAGSAGGFSGVGGVGR
jgi:hypothetical protein